MSNSELLRSIDSEQVLKEIARGLLRIIPCKVIVSPVTQSPEFVGEKLANMLASSPSERLLTRATDCVRESHETGEPVIATVTVSRHAVYQIRVTIVESHLVGVSFRIPAAANSETLLKGLSSREREVLDLIVMGSSNKQIAARLFLSARTVEKHRAGLHRKLETKSVAELTLIWLAAGEIVEPDRH